MKSVRGIENGLAFQDGRLELSDGRQLAWRWWGEEGSVPVLYLQGMPGSRLARHPDSSIQLELGLRYLQADRPGYGGSTRKPGHGIVDLADDLVALLDAQALERVPVIGGSGGGPQALALAARYPARVSAVTIVVGSAPLIPEEAAGIVGLNAEAYIAKQKGWEPLFQRLSAARERVLGEQGIAGELRDAPAGDRAILIRPEIQRLTRIDIAEALRQGAEGWADESFAMRKDWDFDPGHIVASVTWWHGDDDKNVPLTAARRAAARVPHAELRVWHNEGHMAPVTHEREIMEELLSRSS